MLFTCIKLPPKGGKTKEALKIVADNLIKNIPTILISIEDNVKELGRRLLQEHQIQLNNEAVLNNLSIYYNPHITDQWVEMICYENKLKMNGDVCLVFDYCQNDDQLKFLKEKICNALGIRVYTFKQKRCYQ